MIKQSFLNTLKGKDEQDAKDACWDNEHLVRVIPNGMANIALAYGNTVLLWIDEGGYVAEATAGDGLELEDDVLSQST